MAAPLLLFDTFSLFFRAHHALPPMSTRGGEPTAALYGFSALVLKLLRERNCSGLAFALDAPVATFRHEAFSEYKAGRAPTPSALATQFSRLSQLLACLHAPVLRVEGFEADDVLATLARKAREAARPALVVSGDRDLLQVARGSVQVYFVGRRGKDALLYDEAAVRERFGVPAERLPAYVALVGDRSDNLPPVPGIGPVTAKNLLADTEGAEQLFQGIERLAPKLRALLLAHREQILMSERLACLRADVPLPEVSFAPPEPDALRELRALFVELEFKSLLPRLDALLEGAGGDASRGVSS